MRRAEFPLVVPVLAALLVWGGFGAGCIGGMTASQDDGDDDGRNEGRAGARGDDDGDTGSGGADGQGGEAGAGLGGTGGPAGEGGSGPGGAPVAGMKGGAGGMPVPWTCADDNFCDDFDEAEAGKPPPNWQLAKDPAANIVVDDKFAFGDEGKSLSLSVPAGRGKKAFIYKANGPLFPLPDNTLYGRMMVYFESTPTDGTHWTNIQASGIVPDKDYGAQYRYGGQHGNIMANYETVGVASDCWNHSNTRFPTGRWVCFRWAFIGPDNMMRFWLDEEELFQLLIRGRGRGGCVAQDYKDLWWAPAFSKLELGWQHFQETDARRMWIDDIEVGSSFAPCPNAGAAAEM